MNTKANILFVEDDPSLSFVIKDNLEDRGYTVIHCIDGESAWQQFMKHAFDLCLLDVMLPKKDGFTLAAQIRKKNELIPIIMLTAKNMDEDKIQGFKTGVDDYITKPFNMQELLLRMEVFLKRTRIDTNLFPQKVTLGSIVFHYEELELQTLDGMIQLTQKEADLLKYFCQHINQTLKREDILLHVWGKDDYFLGRSMDVFITKLRKHLKSEIGIEIQTIHGKGFKFLMNVS
ncbi:MAG: DNA-binding response regulator [Chitinophagia bacterium]|jgi:DNA-binding response OmpR family regulator|nr:DNA-binding response regulator [Chitinophagia bacterium]